MASSEIIAEAVTVHEVLARLQGVRPSGRGWVARCPAHPDRHPSLSVGVGGDGRVLLYCHRGCQFSEIVRALGLEPRELIGGTALPRRGPGARERARELARERALAEAFEEEVRQTWQELALLRRCAFKVLRSFEDYCEFAQIAHRVDYWDHLLDELACGDTERQVAAWRQAREVLAE